MEEVDRYPNLREVVWVQEEPRNMGARAHMSPRLLQMLPSQLEFGYVGRPERASAGRGLPGRPHDGAEPHHPDRAGSLDPGVGEPGQAAGRALNPALQRLTFSARGTATGTGFRVSHRETQRKGGSLEATLYRPLRRRRRADPRDRHPVGRRRLRRGPRRRVSASAIRAARLAQRARPRSSPATAPTARASPTSATATAAAPSTAAAPTRARSPACAPTTSRAAAPSSSRPSARRPARSGRRHHRAAVQRRTRPARSPTSTRTSSTARTPRSSPTRRPRVRGGQGRRHVRGRPRRDRLGRQVGDRQHLHGDVQPDVSKCSFTANVTGGSSDVRDSAPRRSPAADAGRRRRARRRGGRERRGPRLPRSRSSAELNRSVPAERATDVRAGRGEVPRQAVEQHEPVRLDLGRAPHRVDAVVEVTGVGDRRARPRTAARPSRARSRRRAGTARRPPPARSAAISSSAAPASSYARWSVEQARRARRAGPSWSSTRRSTRVRHGSPSGGHDDQRRRLAAAHVAALALRPPGARPAAAPARSPSAASNAADIAAGTVSRSIMFAWQLQCGPVASPAHGMQSGPVLTATPPLASTTPTWRTARSASAGAAPRAPRPAPAPGGQPVERVRAVGGLDDRLRGDRADARARPDAERADGEPVRLDGRAELAGGGVEGDDRVRAVAHGARGYPAMPTRADRVLDRIRDVPPGLRPRVRRRLAGRPAVRRHRARRTTTTPTVPWHRIVRADGSLAKGSRQRALLEAEGVPFRGDRVDMRVARLP